MKIANSSEGLGMIDGGRRGGGTSRSYRCTGATCPEGSLAGALSVCYLWQWPDSESVSGTKIGSL